jgi:hypothetical protein
MKGNNTPGGGSWRPGHDLPLEMHAKATAFIAGFTHGHYTKEVLDFQTFTGLSDIDEVAQMYALEGLRRDWDLDALKTKMMVITRRQRRQTLYVPDDWDSDDAPSDDAPVTPSTKKKNKKKKKKK